MDFTKNICDIVFKFFWRFYPYHNHRDDIMEYGK
jgi:hypothetical protein